MGNRCIFHFRQYSFLSIIRTIQYFLKLIQKQEGGQKWLDDNIHTFMAVGAPFLGAAKSVRAIV